MDKMTLMTSANGLYSLYAYNSQPESVENQCWCSLLRVLFFQIFCYFVRNDSGSSNNNKIDPLCNDDHYSDSKRNTRICLRTIHWQHTLFKQNTRKIYCPLILKQSIHIFPCSLLYFTARVSELSIGLPGGSGTVSLRRFVSWLGNLETA